MTVDNSHRALAMDQVSELAAREAIAFCSVAVLNILDLV